MLKNNNDHDTVSPEAKNLKGVSIEGDILTQARPFKIISFNIMSW